MAIDRERLATSVLRVGELPAYGWVPPGMNNYSSQSFEYATTPVAERIEIARKLLAEAGYTRDKPLRFELQFNSGEVHTKVAVAVSSMWKEALGVEARLAAVEFKSLVRRHRSARSRHVPVVLGGRLQRPVHLPPVSERWVRH